MSPAEERDNKGSTVRRARNVVGLIVAVMGIATVGVVAPASASTRPAVITATNHMGGYTLDGFGGVHPFAVGTGPAPAATSGAPYWNGWDIARGLTLLANGTGGYTLDGFGGIHPFIVGAGATPPALTGVAYWNGWDIARGVALLPNLKGGYVVDGYGGIHPFATGTNSRPPAARGAPYWMGQDMARGITITADGKGGYVVDRTGALHAFAIGAKGVAPPTANGVFVATGVAVQGAGLVDDSTGGYTVDGYGHLHRFGVGSNARPPAATGAAVWPGWDIARDVALMANPPDTIHAALALSPTSGAAPLTVVADASASTDTDSSPIATYTFDFGDGTTVGPQSKATASHKYAAAGSYAVSVTVADTKGNTAVATAPNPVVVDGAPIAGLQVAPAWNVADFAVIADASSSADTDATPIASYEFDFGDGTTVGPQSKATAAHTYASADTYTVTVTVTDTAGFEGTAARDIAVHAPSSSGVDVYAGYYDTHHRYVLHPKPSPWMGSASTVFVGTPDPSTGGWDTGAVRIDNSTGASVSATVTVTVGKKTFDLWGSRAIPSGQSLILAQTAFQNFDTSDTSTAGCYSCDPLLCITSVSPTVPVINVTIGGVLSRYYDRNQVLNTRGADGAGCPYTGTRNDESQAWTAIPGPG